MAVDNSQDRAIITSIMEHTGLSPSAIARKAGLAASTLTRIHHEHIGWKMSTATLAALREAFPAVFERQDENHNSAYLDVSVLPSFAGMGGGGSGEGEPSYAKLPRRLIEECLRGQASDFELIDVRGDSMMPDFHHGDQILIDRRDRDPRQPGPFALYDGDGYVVKLVERIPQRRGWYRVFSANDRYSPYEVAEEDVRIMGRPVWFARCIN